MSEQQVPPPPYYEGPYQPPRRGAAWWVWALAGCAGCGCIGVPILAAIMFPVFSQARESARRISCLSNEKQQATAIMMYSMDYDQRFPPGSKWMDGAFPYIKQESVFHCPSVDTSGTGERYGYAYNSALSNLSQEKLKEPQTTTLTYDSAAFGRNRTDAVTSLPTPGRHRNANNVSYADGHASPARKSASSE